MSGPGGIGLVVRDRGISRGGGFFWFVLID